MQFWELEALSVSLDLKTKGPLASAKSLLAPGEREETPAFCLENIGNQKEGNSHIKWWHSHKYCLQTFC